MPQYEAVISLGGRLLLAAIFLWSGTHKIFNPEGTQQYLLAYGLTFGTMLLYLGATLIEIAGGVSLALGYLTREAAFMLVAFMVVVTGIFHTHLTDPKQMIHFLKNVAITGGLLYVGAYGPGSISREAQMGLPSDDDSIRPHQSQLALAGRVCLAGIFFVSGVNKLIDPQGTQQYMAAMGIVSVTGLVYAAVVALEMCGALSLLLGGWARIGAGTLLLHDICHHDVSSDVYELCDRCGSAGSAISCDEKSRDHGRTCLCRGVWARAHQPRRTTDGDR